MWPHVDRLLAREAQLSDPEQVDGLKRYRVATRRLRAALRVFREAYSARATRGIRRELSRLADAVGEVRDLDVRTVALNDWAAAREPVLTAEVEPLRAAWIDRRGAASDALLRHVTTRHHARLRAELVAFVTSAERYAVVDDDGPARTIRDRAGSETWAAFERVRVYATVVRWADLATLHQLRIEAKRLRYTIEFLGPLLGPEQARLLELLVQLQDHLGALNDAAIASDATRAFLAERHASLGPDERAAIETYLADREAAVRQLRRGVPRAWRPIASSAFARHLARAIAGPRETPARSRHPAAATANAAATAVPAASS
jgi:CHAD domain-containing protein